MTIRKKNYETVNGKTGYWYSYINVPNDYKIKEDEKYVRPLTDLEAEGYNKRTYSNFLFLMRNDINKNQ